MSTSTSSTSKVSSSDDDSSKLPRSSQTGSLGSNIKILNYEDSPKAAITLLKAFDNDSLAKLLVSDLNDHQLKRDFELALYEAYVRQHISKGLCLGINESDDEFETVAVWSCPDSVERGLESFSTLMESGYGKVWNLGCEGSRNKVFNGLLPLLEHTNERIVTTDPRFKGKGVYTLVYVGSTANARGKGNARKMFDYMFQNYIDLPDTSNITYLESSSVSNIPIYEKFGFKFYEDIILGDKVDENSIEGEDYAVMNIMIRDTLGHDWTKDDDISVAKL